MRKNQRIANVIGVFTLLLLSCESSNTRTSYVEATVEPDTVYYDEISKDTSGDGKNVWYRYKVNGLEGILTDEKKILIEAKYDVVYYKDFLGKFYAVKDDDIEILNVDGTIFIPISREYDFFLKEELSNGNNRYYYSVGHKGLYGICDKEGKEILAPRFPFVDYTDNLGNESLDYDDTNPIGKYGSFITRDDNDNTYIFDIYIDDQSVCRKLSGKKWTRYYCTNGFLKMDDGSYIDSNDKSIFRYYGNYVMHGYEKYYIVNSYSGHERQSLLAEIVNVDGGDYDVDEDIHTFIKHEYMREWEKRGDVSMREFYGKPKMDENSSSYTVVQENTSSYPNVQEVYGGNLEHNNIPDVHIERTKRYPCRACNNTGDCNQCNGSGLDKNKIVNNYDSGTLDIVNGICKRCRGSKKCISCKGDGWLDAGIDF